MPYTNLDFPLNVYAHCLYLQEGSVDYLHYGLFKQGESKMQIAQQRSTDLLLAHLPEPPCRILEIGIGLGKTARQLAERGYTVTGISPDPQQVALAKLRVKDNVTLECVTFEAFSTDAESYDVILLQESAQYLQPLALFNKAHNLLVKQGIILIADEVGLQRTSKDTSYGLPLQSHTLAQAQRCGFDLIKQLDLSAQAALTVEYLLWAIEKHRATLLANLDLKPIVLDELLNALGEYQQQYYDAHYGYVLLSFAKTKPPRWKITPVTAPDKKAVRTLFSEVFQPEQMSDALWEWKYGQKRGLGIAAWRNGNMVAHYGGIMREIHYFGQPKLAVQITDVMVSPKERSVFTRRGAFFSNAATFIECYIGYGAKTCLGYGFPNQRHMKVGQLLGLYAQVGNMIELRWQSTSSIPHLWTRIRHLYPQHQNKLIMNQLWQEMAASLQQALVGVRDWDYVQHRYILHPHHHYELLLVTRRFSGQALGVAVIHRQDETCSIMDFIGDLIHIPETIRQVRRIAKRWGMRQVRLWIAENFATAFPLKSAKKLALDIPIADTIWSKTFPPNDIDGRWWLMSGDTDFL